jgi:hypothetical protein
MDRYGPLPLSGIVSNIVCGLKANYITLNIELLITTSQECAKWACMHSHHYGARKEGVFICQSVFQYYCVGAWVIKKRLSSSFWCVSSPKKIIGFCVDFCLPVWVSVSQESFFLPSLLSLFFCWVACYNLFSFWIDYFCQLSFALLGFCWILAAAADFQLPVEWLSCILGSI